MSWISAICLCLVLMVACSSQCPDVQNTGRLRWTESLTDADYTRLHEFRSISCCAAGYKTIKWLRLDRKTNIWQPFPSGPRQGDVTPTLDDKNQTLSLKSASFADNTTFQCIATNEEGHTLIHNTRLYVETCDYRPEGPLLMQPKNSIKTIPELGGNVDLFCEGYFGCGKDPRWAMWKILEKNQQPKDPEVVDRRHFNVTQYSKDYNAYVGSKLTILNVEKEDLDRGFQCLLISAQVIKSIQNKTVHLELDPGVMAVVRPIIIGVAVVFFLIILICILKWFYGPQILLFYRVHIVPSKMVITAQDEYDCNAFLYHADEDERTARLIKEELENHNYEIMLTSDVRGNMAMLQAYEKESKRSARVIFLYSKNLLKDPLANFFLQNLMTSRLVKKIFFVILNKAVITQEIVAEMLNTAEDNQTAAVQEDQGHDQLDIDASGDNGGHGSDRQTESHLDILKFWRILPRLHFPAENDSQRKHKNFWCELQLKIPRFKHQINRNRKPSSIERPSNGRNSSSDTPLMDQQESPTFPGMMDNPVDVLTPTLDQVFTFGEIPQHNHGRRRHRAGTNSDSDIDMAQVNRDITVDVHVGQGPALSVVDNVNNGPMAEQLNFLAIPQNTEGDLEPQLVSSSQEHVFEMSGEETIPLDREGNNGQLSLTESGHQRSSESGYSGSVGYQGNSFSTMGELSPPDSMLRENLISSSSGASDMSPETGSTENSSGKVFRFLLSRDNVNEAQPNDHHGNTLSQLQNPVSLNVKDVVPRNQFSSQSSQESGYASPEGFHSTEINNHFLPDPIPEET